jgi:hypothetical protein
VSEHPDIGSILPLDGKDTYGKPIRGLRVSLSLSRWLVYDEPAARELHRMLSEMIAEWDAANATGLLRQAQERSIEMTTNVSGPAVSSTRLLDDLVIILSEAAGELAVQEVDLHRFDIPGAKQRRRNADERITAAMRLIESTSNSATSPNPVAGPEVQP